MFNPKLIHETHSPYSGSIKVYESNGERRLVVGGFTQSRSLKKNGKSDGYWDAFAQFDPPAGGLKNILILGLGAGTMVKLLNQRFGPVPIDAVEIDPVVVETAQKYFDLNEKNANIIIADAEGYLEQTEKKYDLICVDVFRWDEVPQHCEKDLFYQNLAKVLRTEGTVIFNRIIDNSEVDRVNAYANYLEKFFNRVEILTVPGALKSSNVIFYAKGR